MRSYYVSKYNTLFNIIPNTAQDVLWIHSTLCRKKLETSRLFSARLASTCSRVTPLLFPLLSTKRAGDALSHTGQWVWYKEGSLYYDDKLTSSINLTRNIIILPQVVRTSATSPPICPTKLVCFTCLNF